MKYTWQNHILSSKKALTFYFFCFLKCIVNLKGDTEGSIESLSHSRRLIWMVKVNICCSNRSIFYVDQKKPWYMCILLLEIIRVSCEKELISVGVSVVDFCANQPQDNLAFIKAILKS